MTCQKILASAKKIFARDGFQAAKLEEIAAEAGYTRGAFYANFTSKEELFLAVAGHQISSLNSTILQAVRSKSGLEPKCQELMKAARGNPEVRTWALLLSEFKLFALRQPNPKKHIDMLHERMLGGLLDVFEDLYKAAKCKPPVPLEIIAMGFGILFQGFALQEILSSPLVTPKVTSDMLNRYVHAMISDR